MPLPFSGPATRLQPWLIPEIAAAAGIAYPFVAAVASVECGRRSGFLPDGRPLILFEAAHFHEHTLGRYGQSHPQISSPTWNRRLYASTSAGEYSRLAEAIALDRRAALLSASWGLFQIMGENYASCEFGDIESFVSAMMDSEAAHLKAFLAFIRREGMLQPLLAKDWDGFAGRYNGPRFAENGYDAKLADAYNHALLATPPARPEDMTVVDVVSPHPAAPTAAATLNVRSGPGVLNPVIAGSPLAKGEPVDILQRNPSGWVEVSFRRASSTYKGWVNGSFLG